MWARPVRYSFVCKAVVRIGIITLCVAGFGFSVYGQRPVPGLRPEEAQRDSLPPSGIMPLDTPVPVTYILIGDPDRVYTTTDTLQWKDNRHLPLTFTDAHLGNYGSATRSFFPEARQPIGFATGWFQYEPFYVSHDRFRYYHQEIPVARIGFSQASQEDNTLALEFGRGFSEGLSMSISYRRINQIGEWGHQRQKTTGLGVGVWHKAPHGRYQAFYHFLANGAVTEENGGISAPELIGDDRFPDLSVPVFISNGITTHKHRSFLSRHILRLLRDTSDLRVDLFAQVRLSSGLYKYVDRNPEPAADYYGDRFLPDARGIRQHAFVDEKEFSAGIMLPVASLRSEVEASLRYRNLRVDQEPLSRRLHELYLEGKGRFQWVEPLVLRGDLSLGLGQAEGNFSIRATGELKAGPLGHLTGHWHLSGRRPYMIENALYVTELPAYETAWRNPLTQDVGVSWQWDEQQLTARVQWLLFDNLIYFDTLRLPNQIEGAFSLQRFTFSKAFDWRWLGLSGSVVWQPDPDPRLAVPALAGYASLYGRLRIFRQRLTLMPGVDLTYHGTMPGVSYYPVTGAYHLTGREEIPAYLRIDPGVIMKINFLQVSVRMEDVVGLFSNRVLYQADFYPHYPGYLRIGLTTSFFN